MTSNNNSGAAIGAPGALVGANSANSAGIPTALKTEMNKVDVIVDGRSVAGMYQVVHHRIETISTTNAVVPRAVIDVEQQVRIFSLKDAAFKNCDVRFLTIYLFYVLG